MTDGKVTLLEIVTGLQFCLVQLAQLDKDFWFCVINVNTHLNNS